MLFPYFEHVPATIPGSREYNLEQIFNGELKRCDFKNRLLRIQNLNKQVDLEFYHYYMAKIDLLHYIESCLHCI